MEIIQRMDESSIGRFKKDSLEDRNQPAYIKLFQHLFRKIQAGAIAESVNESEIRKWAKEHAKSYDDLIANLHKRLLEFLGTEFAASQEEQWHRKMNQRLDQIEALLSMELYNHAFPMIEALEVDLQSRLPEYHGKWTYTLARFIFVKCRWQHSVQGVNLPWVNEIGDLIQSMSHSYATHSRKDSAVPKSEYETQQEWSGSAILLRLRYLHAEHYGDYNERIQSLESYLNAPTIRGFRETTRKQTQRNNEASEIQPGYAEPLDFVEQFFLRLLVTEYACLHGDFQRAAQILKEPYEVPAARVLYPACNLWATYQFYGRRAAYLFATAKEDQGLPLDQFLEYWEEVTLAQMEALPLRMEIHQILIQCGTGRFDLALERTRNLLDLKRKHLANPDLRMIEVLARLETKKECWEEAGKLLAAASKQQDAKWKFAKAFAKFMTRPPYLQHGSHSLIHDMKRKKEAVDEILQLADPSNPTHQLILWRIRRWQAGENLERLDSRHFSSGSI